MKEQLPSADNATSAAVPPKMPLPRNVKVLGGVSLLNDIASETVFPLLPDFLLRQLGGSKAGLGLIEGVADTASSVLKLWSGGWSDRAGGRKGFVVFGYAVTALVRPLIGIITLPWQLLAIRLSDRVGKGVRTSPRDALIADSTPPQMRGRAFGFHRAMDHVGAAIGPLLAAAFLWLWPEEMRLLFLLTIVPGILVVVLAVFGLRESPRQTAESAPPKEPFRLTLAPFDGNFRLYLLALVVFTLGNSSDAFLLVRSQELGVPVVLLPVLWCAFHVVKSAGNLLLGPLVDKFGPRLFLFLGWLVYAGIYLAFALAANAWQAWAFFLAYAIFYGLTEPAEKTLVANLVAPEHKGLAFGWFNFAMGLAALPSSLMFGLLYDRFGPLVAFGWGAALAVLAVVLLAWVRAKHPGVSAG